MCASQTGFLGNPDLKTSVDFLKPKEALDAVFDAFKSMTQKKTNYALITSVMKMWGYECCSGITKHRSELAVMEVVRINKCFHLPPQVALIFSPL